MADNLLNETVVLMHLLDPAYSIAAFHAQNGQPRLGLHLRTAGGCWGRIPDDVIDAMIAKGWLTKPTDINDWPRITSEGRREAACRNYGLVRAPAAVQQVHVVIVCRNGEEDPPRIFSTMEKAAGWVQALPDNEAAVIFLATVDDPDELTRRRADLS